MEVHKSKIVAKKSTVTEKKVVTKRFLGQLIKRSGNFFHTNWEFSRPFKGNFVEGKKRTQKCHYVRIFRRHLQIPFSNDLRS